MFDMSEDEADPVPLPPPCFTPGAPNDVSIESRARELRIAMQFASWGQQATAETKEATEADGAEEADPEDVADPVPLSDDVSIESRVRELRVATQFASWGQQAIAEAKEATEADGAEEEERRLMEEEWEKEKAERRRAKEGAGTT